MSDPCNTCAFRTGSVTHESEPHNRLKGMICAAAGIPFFCHCGWDHENIDVYLIDGRFVTTDDVDLRKIRTCAGWRREIARLKAAGQFAVSPDVRDLQKQLGAHALTALKEFIESPEGEAKDEAEIRLWRLTEMVMQKP